MERKIFFCLPLLLLSIAASEEVGAGSNDSSPGLKTIAGVPIYNYDKAQNRTHEYKWIVVATEDGWPSIRKSCRSMDPGMKRCVTLSMSMKIIFQGNEGTLSKFVEKQRENIEFVEPDAVYGLPTVVRKPSATTTPQNQGISFSPLSLPETTRQVPVNSSTAGVDKDSRAGWSPIVGVVVVGLACLAILPFIIASLMYCYNRMVWGPVPEVKNESRVFSA